MTEKHMLITGASKGLGKDIAEYFLQQGWMVYGCARSAGTIDQSQLSSLSTRCELSRTSQ